jgi:hypothetical protein
MCLLAVGVTESTALGAARCRFTRVVARMLDTDMKRRASVDSETFQELDQ